MTNFYRLLNIILGLAFFSYIFYNRLFRDRWPKDLVNVIGLKSLIIYLVIILINIIFLIIILYVHYRKSSGDENLSIVRRIMKFLKEKIDHIFEDLGSLYLNLSVYIPNHDDFIIKSSEYYFKIPRIYRNIFVILLLTLPRIIVLLGFVIDIFVFNKFYYFYNLLWLLLIPLGIRFIFCLFQEVVETVYDVILKYINVIELRGSYIEFSTIKDVEYINRNSEGAIISLKEEYQSEYSLSFFSQRYVSVRDFMSALHYSIILKSKVDFFLGVTIRITYIIGWSYVIFLGTNNFTSFPF